MDDINQIINIKIQQKNCYFSSSTLGFGSNFEHFYNLLTTKKKKKKDSRVATVTGLCRTGSGRCKCLRIPLCRTFRSISSREIYAFSGPPSTILLQGSRIANVKKSSFFVALSLSAEISSIHWRLVDSLISDRNSCKEEIPCKTVNVLVSGLESVSLVSGWSCRLPMDLKITRNLILSA